ncbi:MAG: hypothetical protein ACP5MD_03540 [Verrucomicrobiia bacterium]
MSITGYKRFAFVLAFLCVCLLLVLAYGFREYSRVNRIAWKQGFLIANFRQAHDIVRLYEADRDLALKQDVTNAVERLYKLQGPSLPFPKNHPATHFMEHERQRAVRDVIAYLQVGGGEPPPRFCVQSRAAIRKPLVCSGVTVGGGRSSLAFDE